MSWTKRAACVGKPPSLFFEDYEEGSEDMKDEVEKICESCVVREECLNTARGEKAVSGVWGGVFFRNGVAKRRKRQAA